MKRSETAKKTPQSSRRKGFTADDYKRMIALYESGQSSTEVAKEFGCSGGRVLQVLHEHGIQVRPSSKTRISDAARQEMVVLYGQGKTCAEIASIYSCSSVAVLGILRGLGVRMRRTSVPGEYSEEVRREVVRMYNEGLPQYKIIARFGFAGKTVKKILDESGVARRSSTQFQSRYTDEDHRRMVAMYEQGAKLQAIADEFSCSRFALDRIFTKLGVQKRPASPHRRFSQDEFERILDMSKKGYKNTEIAIDIGTSKETIGKILHRLRSPSQRQTPVFSEHDRRRMVDLYEIGLSTGAIAEEYQCGKKDVREVLAEGRIKLRPNKVRDTFSAKDRRRMLGMYTNNISGTEIAEQFHCDLKTLALILNLAGIDAGPDVPPLRVEKISDAPRSMNLPSSPSSSKSPAEPRIPSTSPGRDSLDTFIRNFWATRNRAVEVMLLPPDARALLVAQVNDALKDAYEKLSAK